tara:strand:+ start:1080 stop:1598 length:519 start_codon:yes stop_codon:yes gene_type:complete
MNNIRIVQPPQQADLSLIVTDDINLAPIAPPLELSTLKLTGIKGYDEKRRSLKMLKIKAETVAELRKAFAIFDKVELQLNHSVVLFVAQIVEDIFNKPMQGDVKRDIVVDICKEYFNGDSALVEMVLDLVFEKVIKTTMWRRNKQRMKNVCVFFFKIFGPSIQTNLSSRLKL